MFTNFFTALGSFFCGSTEGRSQRKTVEKDPLAAIVNTIIDKNLMDWTQPFIRISEVGVFNAFSVDKQVKILTTTIARAHAWEGSSIDYTDSTINTVFIYPSYVQAPLKIKKEVAIVSPAP